MCKQIFLFTRNIFAHLRSIKPLSFDIFKAQLCLWYITSRAMKTPNLLSRIRLKMMSRLGFT